jgi:hypothetical protein
MAYLLGGGDDILRPPSAGRFSPTDIFPASGDGTLPAATLSLLIVSSAGPVLNLMSDSRLDGPGGRLNSPDCVDPVRGVCWPSSPMGLNESLKTMGLDPDPFDGDEAKSCSGTVSSRRGLSLLAGSDIFLLQ